MKKCSHNELVGKKLFIVFIIVLGLFLVFPKNLVFSYHQKQVLGTDEENLPQLAGTAEGPGLVLPDSPLFFLDEVKQNIRLLLAFTPEEKAKVYKSIAGERFAELRLMLAKENKKEVDNTLRRIEEKFDKAATHLEEARLKGKDVSMVARQINESIKEKQKALDALRANSNGSFESKIEGLNKSILQSKVKVEESLPPHEIEKEIEEHLERKIEQGFDKSIESAQELEEDLREFEKHAVEAAKKSLVKKEETMRKAVEKKDDAQRKAAEKLWEAEKKKLLELLEVKMKAIEEAKKAIRKAHEAAEEYRKAHEAIIKINSGDESLETDDINIPEIEALDEELNVLDSSESSSDFGSKDSDRSGSNNGEK